MLIAHRGLVDSDNKDNSYSAIINALNSSKYSGVEMDVRESKDKKLILVHDPLYKGLLINKTNSKKLVKMGLVLLDDVLKIKTNKLLLIEIKDNNINKKKLVSKLNKYNNIYVMSFNKKYIKGLIKYKPSFKIGYLNYIFNSENDYSEFDFICLLNSIISSKIINYFKYLCIELFSYGINKSIEVTPGIKYIVDDSDVIYK